MSNPERSARSVYVGNIPYEATEEVMKTIFQNVGPVVNFRIVYDRETGKPKGYGFCEYQDVETAQSAIRNLNNHDFNGRPLRVGAAAGDSVKDEGKMGPIGIPVQESPFGAELPSHEVPEAISRAVASLPPEQMYELMKQMKLCIQNNPNEARNMLLQNPQLAYALLQAQIVMKIVDPQVAMAMLHRQTEQIPPLMPTKSQQEEPMEMAASGSAPAPPGPGFAQERPLYAGGGGGPSAHAQGSRETDAFSEDPYGERYGRRPDRGGYGADFDERRGAPSGGSYDRRDPRGPPRGGRDFRGDYGGGGSDYRDNRDYGRGDPRSEHRGGHDPRGGPTDSRSGSSRGDPRGGPPRPPQPPQRPAPPSIPGNLAQGLSAAGSGGEQEKAALIMQVLQLSEEQIAMLPPDQRQSIAILKQQIQRTGQR